MLAQGKIEKGLVLKNYLGLTRIPMPEETDDDSCGRAKAHIFRFFKTHLLGEAHE